jgi:hypothetical protein
MTVLDYKWINTSGGCVGIVLAESEYYGQQAYMCVVPGNDEKSDIERVKDWGVKQPLEVAQAYFPKFVDANKYGNS